MVVEGMGMIGCSTRDLGYVLGVEGDEPLELGQGYTSSYVLYD